MEVSEAFLLKTDSFYRRGLAAKARGLAGEGVAQPQAHIRRHIAEEYVGTALRRRGI